MTYIPRKWVLRLTCTAACIVGCGGSSNSGTDWTFAGNAGKGNPLSGVNGGATSTPTSALGGKAQSTGGGATSILPSGGGTHASSNGGDSNVAGAGAAVTGTGGATFVANGATAGVVAKGGAGTSNATSARGGVGTSAAGALAKGGGGGLGAKGGTNSGGFSPNAGMNGAGTTAHTGNGGTGGGGATVCCLAMPTCRTGDTEVSSKAMCPNLDTCYSLSLCCTTIWCTSSVALCDGIPTCNTGDTEMSGACPPDDSCYARTLCGTTINCRRTACATDQDYNRRYVGTTPAECSVVRFACEANTTPFSDRCGCGCEQHFSCPRWVSCMPGGGTLSAMCSDATLCPLTIRAM